MDDLLHVPGTTPFVPLQVTLIPAILQVVPEVMEVVVRGIIREELMVVVVQVVVLQIVVVLLLLIHNMVELVRLVAMVVIGDLMVEEHPYMVEELLVVLLRGRIISLIQTQLLPHSEVLDSNSYF